MREGSLERNYKRTGGVISTREGLNIGGWSIPLKTLSAALMFNCLQY